MTREQDLIKKYRKKLEGARNLLASLPRECEKNAMREVIAGFEKFLKELEAKQCAS